MRILIFGEAILPPAYLPRVRYFCSYFMEKGWDVDWVLENSDYLNYAPKEAKLFPIDYYKNKHGIIFKIEWIIKFVLNLFWDHKSLYFYKKSKRNWIGKRYDIIFCSSCFTFPLATAAKTAKQLNIPLFVDLRDIVEQSPDDNYYLAQKPPKFFGNLIFNIYKKKNIKRRNAVLKIADGITTISPWHVLTLSKYNSNIYLIYNGFDEDKIIPEKIKTERFTISYFGRLYNEKMRNPRLVLSALHKLRLKGILLPENTVVNWFIDDNSKKIVTEIAQEYDLEAFIKYNNFIEPDNLSDEMNRSSVLLVLNNEKTNKRYFGIMTTKFFEALGANRPIICTPDNQDNLAKLIREISCGIVTSEESDIEEFLFAHFQEWQKKGYTEGTLNQADRKNFSRENGAKILENIFLNVLKKRQDTRYQ